MEHYFNPSFFLSPGSNQLVLLFSSCSSGGTLMPKKKISLIFTSSAAWSIKLNYMYSDSIARDLSLSPKCIPRFLRIFQSPNFVIIKLSYHVKFNLKNLHKFQTEIILGLNGTLIMSFVELILRNRQKTTAHQS